jgi:glutathione S-transferase
MFTVYQTPPAWGLPSLSVFCTKLTAFFRLSGLPFRTAPADLREAPKGKVPYVDHEGRRLADSFFVQRYCRDRFGDTLDRDLPPEAHALGRIVIRACEEGLYFVILYHRWAADEGFAETSKILAGAVPPEMMPALRTSVVEQLVAQGTARHSPEEVAALGRADIEALANVLGRKRFLFGDQPRSYDASLFAHLAHVMATPTANPVSDLARSQASLVDYVARFRAAASM